MEMDEKTELERQVERAKESIKSWPCWMQRTGHFHGSDCSDAAARFIATQPSRSNNDG